MVGVAMREHDDRYAEGREWLEIVSRIWAGEGPFDYEGSYYQLRGLVGSPRPFADLPPIIMNAGSSPAAGLPWSTPISTLTPWAHPKQRSIASPRPDRAAALGRSIQVWTPVGIICRPTRQEAQDYLQYCADHTDWGAVGMVVGGADPASTGGSRVGARAPAHHPREWLAVARGAYCCVGDPDDVAREILQLHEMGLDGLAINFVDYLKELPYFAQEILPRLERQGLRTAVKTQT